MEIPELSIQAMVIGLCVALGTGLLVGAERERRKAEGAHRGAAGIRTFTVSALLGAVSLLVGGNLLLAVAALVVGAGALVAYQRSQSPDPGLTTEIALLLTCLLGAMAVTQPLLAAALGTTLAILLAGRQRMHQFVKNALSEQELHDIILFLAAALIVLPLAPDRFMGPFDALNPHAMAQLIVLTMAIGAAGYVAIRTLGVRYGLPLAGFAAGFVSSIATIHAMGERARRIPGAATASAAGAALSSVATILQLAMVITLIEPRLMREMLLPLGLGGLLAGLYGGVLMLRAVRGEPPASDTGRAFNLKTSATFAVLVAMVLMVSAAMNAWLGALGGLLGAAFTGLVDAHATAAASASLVAGGKIPLEVAIWPVAVGLSTNTVVKAAVAFHAGGARFAWRVVPGLALMLMAVWLGLWLNLLKLRL